MRVDGKFGEAEVENFRRPTIHRTGWKGAIAGGTAAVQTEAKEGE